MRVAVNVRVLSDSNLRGWNRYAINLISGLVDLGIEVYLYTDRTIDPAQLALLPGTGFVIRQAPPMNYLAWEQWWIPRRCKADKIEIFHSPTHFGLPQQRSVKCVLTLHDAIDEIYYASPLWKKSSSQWLTASLCRMARHRADHIITVSEHSRQDLIRELGIPRQRISVTYEAADQRFHEEVSHEHRMKVRAEYKLPEKFVFYVGSLEPRKNVPFVLEALAMAKAEGLRFAIGGGSRKEEQAALLKRAAELNLEGRVHLLGRIPDGDLPALYAEAEAFVYPSEYEGFGLQLCEAMATGCPVFASRASCLPEILAGGGESFPLATPAYLAELLTAVHSNREWRDGLAVRARNRSKHFSWKQTALDTLAVYRSLV